LPYVAFVVFGSLFVRSSGSFWRELFPRFTRGVRETMTITIINKATRREQQQNGPCPWVVDVPPEPRK
jgi:hypothetical protein